MGNNQSESKELLDQVLLNKDYANVLYDLAGMLVEDIVKINRVIEDNDTELTDQQLKEIKLKRFRTLFNLVVNNPEELEGKLTKLKGAF